MQRATCCTHCGHCTLRYYWPPSAALWVPNGECVRRPAGARGTDECAGGARARGRRHRLLFRRDCNAAATRSRCCTFHSRPPPLAASLSISVRLPFPPFNAALCAILEQAEELRRYRRKHPTASALTQAELDAFLQDAFIPSVRCMDTPAHARTHADTHCLDAHGMVRHESAPCDFL